MQHLQQVALYLWQFDVRTVATLETRVVDFHFLAFHAWRDATYEDDCFCLTYLSQQVLSVWYVFLADIKLHGSHTVLLHIVYLDAIALALLDVQRGLSLLNALAYLPDVHQCVAVHQYAHLIVGTNLECQRLVFRWNQGTQVAG